METPIYIYTSSARTSIFTPSPKKYDNDLFHLSHREGRKTILQTKESGSSFGQGEFLFNKEMCKEISETAVSIMDISEEITLIMYWKSMKDVAMKMVVGSVIDSGEFDRVHKNQESLFYLIIKN